MRRFPRPSIRGFLEDLARRSRHLVQRRDADALRDAPDPSDHRHDGDHQRHRRRSRRSGLRRRFDQGQFPFR